MNDKSPKKSELKALDIEALGSSNNAPYSVPSTSSASQPAIGGTQKITQVQQQVQQVTDIMQENITKILDRGHKLDHLEDRSELLSSKSEDFRVSGRRLGRKMKWQNMRLSIIIILVVIAIILILYFTLKK